MLSIFLDPSVFQKGDALQAELQRFITWVKSSAKTDANADILMPGEIEDRTKAKRLRDGIELDPTTWSQIQATAKAVGLNA